MMEKISKKEMTNPMFNYINIRSSFLKKKKKKSHSQIVFFKVY